MIILIHDDVVCALSDEEAASPDGVRAQAYPNSMHRLRVVYGTHVVDDSPSRRRSRFAQARTRETMKKRGKVRTEWDGHEAGMAAVYALVEDTADCAACSPGAFWGERFRRDYLRAAGIGRSIPDDVDSVVARAGRDAMRLALKRLVGAWGRAEVEAALRELLVEQDRLAEDERFR